MTCKPGRVTGPGLRCVQRLTSRAFDLSLPWDRWRGHGRVGRQQWGHWGMTGMVALVRHWRWVVLRKGRDRASCSRGAWPGGVSGEGFPESRGAIDQVWLRRMARFLGRQKEIIAPMSNPQRSRSGQTDEIRSVFLETRLVPWILKRSQGSRSYEWCHPPWPDGTEEQLTPCTGCRGMQCLWKNDQVK